MSNTRIGLSAGASAPDMMVENKNRDAMNIYKVFAELSLTIKTAIDVQNMFEGGCLLAME